MTSAIEGRWFSEEFLLRVRHISPKGFVLSRYIYCDQTIISHIAIPELLHDEHRAPGFLVDLKPSEKQSDTVTWSFHWLSARGETLLSHGRQGSGHCLRFPNLADFQISEDITEIFCYPLPAVPQETIRHLLLDQVMPRCLAHQGRIMLHASAVRLEYGLILFIGDSGAGKSTLAGNFHRAGHAALSDDCVWVEEKDGQITAVPSYGGLRLWEDSLAVLFGEQHKTSSVAHYSSKQRVSLKENAGQEIRKGIPVLGLIVLSPPDKKSAWQISLERLPNREAFIAMLKQTFQLDVNDLERMARHAQRLGRIVPRIPAYRLSMQRDYSLLPLARQKILEAVLSL